MKIIIAVLSLLSLSIYSIKEYTGTISETLPTNQFVGMSLIYASIPLLTMAIAIYFISTEMRAKSWKHASGLVDYVEKKKTLFGTKYMLSYSYRINDIRYTNSYYCTREKWTPLGRLMLNPAFRNGKPNTWEGKRVKVFFNKENFSDSVLSQNVEISSEILLFPALTMLAISSYVIFRLI